MNFEVFAPFWILLCAVALHRVLRVLREPRELLSPISVVTFGFLFLYVVAFALLGERSRHELLSLDGYLKVLALACLSLGLFHIGYSSGTTPRPRNFSLAHRTTEWIAFALFVFSFGGWLVFLVRSGGFVAFYGSVHGAAGAWDVTSAYVYDLRYLLYPTLYLLLALRSGGRLSALGTLLLCFLLVFLIADAWWLGSRGGWLRLLLVTTIALFLLQRRAVLSRAERVALPILVLAVIALVVVTPYLRAAMHLGADRSLLEEAQVILADQNPLVGSVPGEGNELVFASALVEAAASEGIVDFGSKWTFPIVGFVPRAWWPNKPYAAEWSVNEAELVYRVHGWEVGFGATPTGLADGFVRLSWLSPVVWLLLGVWGGRLWRRGLADTHPVSLAYVCAFQVGLIYAITQGFLAAFFAWFYFVVPVAAWTRLGRLPVR